MNYKHYLQNLLKYLVFEEKFNKVSKTVTHE